LYARSYYSGDKQEAVDLFDRVIRGYPKSSYRAKAQQAQKRLRYGQPKKTEVSSDARARTYYKQAQAKYRQIQHNPGWKKYRDKWLACANGYLKAYGADTDGPLAAASLFGAAQCYEELYTHSYRTADKAHGRERYRQLIDEFPDSAYATKAATALGVEIQTPVAPPANDDISQVIVQNAPYQEPSAENGPMATSETPAVVEGLRFWSNPRYTRVVIDADRDTVFSYRELREDPSIGKPQRIYIDVHQSRLGKNIQKVVPINDNLLSDARAGQYSGDTVRVVVDIKSFKTFKIFSLKNPFRVVLDVWGIDVDHATPKQVQPPVAGKRGEKLPPSAIVKQLALGVRRIVIDPGHGGRDYGAPGYLKGVHEKYVVLQIAKQLKQMITAELKCDVLLTRSGDKYLSLEERTAIANTKNADLFISIHTNASSDRRAYGIETYILNLATDDEAIRVAAMENATSKKNISDLDSILQDLMKNAKVSESTRLASYVQQSISSRLKKAKYKNIRNKGIKQAPFYVLLGADMPSILIETSFISNPRECKRLSDVTYQKQLCRGILEGIKRYIKETNPVAYQQARTVKVKG
jgi:N-acetylmuramoyl-L-alanine amidase